jgi:hypothetical protein
MAFHKIPLSKLEKVVTILTFVRGVPGLNLGRDTGYPELFYPRSLQASTGIIPGNRFSFHVLSNQS